MNNEELRIEAHKKAYEDLKQWIMHQFDTEIKFLLPSAVMTIKEWYSLAIKDMIQGALVHIEIKDWFDSETVNFLCNVLGAKDYRVKAYPACRLHITLQVPISSQAKVAMQCTGTWTPIWRKKDESEKK